MENDKALAKISPHLKAELTATCSTLGHLHKGEYLIEPQCLESVKDLIRYLKRDLNTHDIRRFLGEAKILQNDLVHIIKSCTSETQELFDVTIRLLINLTTPTMLLFSEEVPTKKIEHNIYLSLIDYEQEQKSAFCDVEFWNKICGRLTTLFEIDWTERSADDGIQIERILMLLRNVLQVPANAEDEKVPENNATVHDRVLWALRQSQILELLLFVSSNQHEEQYYLNLLEIFSLTLRDQNPKWLAQCDVQRSNEEKTKDIDDLIKFREIEKRNMNKYTNTRSFNTTYVLKGVKSLSDNDIFCHRSLNRVLDVKDLSKKQIKVKKNKVPVESDRIERHSTFSVRLFLKEFSLEFLNSGFGRLMSVVKNRIDSGKSLAHDESYYFWALKFFLDFASASDSDVNLIKDCLSTESFHFVQTNMDSAFEHLLSEKKRTADWVKRIHLILKAYQSLLEALLWMDHSKSPLVRSLSREIKSEIFYVVEYREMTLHLLLRYDHTKFSISYLRDLIETTHLFIKLLEDYSKQTKLVVQKISRIRSSKKIKKKESVEVTKEEKWEKIKNDVYDTLSGESSFPEIPPFDAASDIPIDDQKGKAMKKIQKFLHEENIREAIGLLRSARQVWPENDYFGSQDMSVEDETMAMQEICLADLDEIEGDDEKIDPLKGNTENEKSDEEEEEDEEKKNIKVYEQDFDIMDYKKRLVNKKVVEGCGMLLKNYQRNSNHTNHCAIKLLHRIGWECCMPAMLYQASLFWTLLKIMKDNRRNYDEINTFTLNLVRKFRKHACKNPVIFLELLFWKENNVALEIQHGYEAYEDKEKPKKRVTKKKSKKTKDHEGGEEPETEELNTMDLDNNLEKPSKKTKNLPKKSQKGGKKPRKSRKKEAAFHVEENSNAISEDISLNSPFSKSNEESEDEDKLVNSPASESRKESESEKSDKSDGEFPGFNNLRKNMTLDSSDDEGQDQNSDIDLQNCSEAKEKMQPFEKTVNSDQSRVSESLSQKRSRDNFDSDNTDDSNRSKLKRFRYVESDSDADIHKSDDEGPIRRKSRRKNLGVIDSDSD